MFQGCENIINIDFIYFNTKNVITMESMFNKCKKLKNINFLSSFDTRNVTNMCGMFEGCNELKKLDLFDFDTKKVIKWILCLIIAII